MASGLFDDLLPGTVAARAPASPEIAASTGLFDDLLPKPPGFFSTVGANLGRGITQAGQELADTATAPFTDPKRPPHVPDAIDTFRDETHYLSPTWYAANIAHGLGRSAPSLVTGIGGAVAGGAVGGLPGAAIGGGLGAGFTSAFQALGAAYQRGRADNLSHDDAADRAIKVSGIEGLAGAAMGALPFGAAFGRTAEGALKAPIKEALLQVFGTQPLAGRAAQVAENAVEGKPTTTGDMVRGYAVDAASGALFLPLALHNPRRPTPPETLPETPSGQLLLPPPAIPMGGPDSPRGPIIDHEPPLALPPPRPLDAGSRAQILRSTLDAGADALGPSSAEPTGFVMRGQSDPLALIARHESGNRPLIGWGDTDLSGYPLSDTGFPAWPGMPGPKGNSTAAGLYQITRTTWDPIARRLGIKDFSTESQRAVAEELFRTRGFEPWAPHNEKLAAAIARGEAGDLPNADAIGREPLLALPAPQRLLPRPDTTYGDNFLMSDSRAKPTADGAVTTTPPSSAPLDRALYEVSRLDPGEPVTRRFLAQLSGFRNHAQIAALRDRLVSRGLVKSEGGRYTRAATANVPETFAPRAPAEATAPLNPRPEMGQDRLTPTEQPPAPPFTAHSVADATGAGGAPVLGQRGPAFERPATQPAPSPAIAPEAPSNSPIVLSSPPSPLPEIGAPLPPGVVRRPAPAPAPAGTQRPITTPAATPTFDTATAPPAPEGNPAERSASPAPTAERAPSSPRKGGDDRMFARNAEGETAGVGMPRSVNQDRARIWAKGDEAALSPETPEPPTEAPGVGGGEPRDTESAAPTTRIEDAGEKIGGARKDRWARRALTAGDLDGMTGGEESKYVTKNAVWPQPDYAALIADGMEPQTAALLKIIRDRLSAKPRSDTPDGRRGYIEMMGVVREAFEAAKTPDDLTTARDEVIRGLNWAQNWRDRATREKLFSIFKGRKEDLGFDRADIIKAESMVRTGFPAVAEEAWLRGVEFKPEPSFRIARGESFKEGPPRTAVYRNGKYVRMFDTEDVARDWLREEHEKRGRDRDEGKLPERPHLDNIARTGRDVRGGRDVDSPDFANAFGFRGVEFGNWVAGDERQKAVNLAYDGLHDLADTLGVDPKALSLDGKLGMAFGARGIGRFAAHYESDKLVINLTKLSGAGSLAHEWGHAFDHYFGELDRTDANRGAARGASGWYEQRDYSGRRPMANLRPEMAAAFDNLMSAMFRRDKTRAETVRDAEQRVETLEGQIAEQRRRVDVARENNPTEAGQRAAEKFARDSERYVAQQERVLEVTKRRLAEARGEGDIPLSQVDTSYYQQARALSGKAGSSGYWARPTEMFARAFEAYVFDKIHALDRASDYLVQGVEGDRYAEGFKGNPYPAGMEREAISAAFDRLVETMQTREGTSGNPALHQRPGASNDTAPAVDRAGLRDELYRIAKERAPTLRLSTMAELMGTIEGRPSPIHGSYHTEARPGGLMEHIASIALDGPDPQHALSHEIVHFLKGAGLFTPAEWKVLAGRADKWADDFKVGERYGDQSPGIRREEAIAEAYAAWDRGDLLLPPGLRRIFGKAKEFFERISNWLRGEGFQSAEDVFRGIDRGEVGARTDDDFTNRALNMAETAMSEPMHARPRTPEDERVRGALDAIRTTPDDRPLWQRSLDFAKRAATRARDEGRYQVIDSFDPIATIEKAASGGKLRDASISAFKAAHLSRELPTMMSAVVGIPDGQGGFLGGVPMLKNGGYVTNPNSKPLSAGLKPIFEAGRQDAYELWLAVTRGKRLLSEGRERLITPEIIAEHRNDHLRPENLGPNGENLFQNAQREWTSFNKHLLDFAEQTGLVNKDQRAMWERGDYVPFFRSMGEENPIGPGRGPRGIVNQSSGIKTLTGGTEKLNSLYENMFTLSESLVSRGLKNEAARRTRDLAEPLGGMEKVSLAEQMASKGKRGDDVVSVMEGGKQQYFRVTQPLLYKAIASFGPVEAGAVVNLLGMPKRLLTTLVTHEPTFMAANLMRDSLHAWVVTGADFKPGFDTAKGAMSALRNSPSAMAIMAGGGGGQHFYGKGATGFVRDLDGNWTPLNSPRKLWEALDRVGSASEMANRIAIYESALKRGSQAEAVWQAKDMLNFTASGGGELMKFLVQTVPFMNARVQGLDRLQRGVRENPASFLLRGGLITAASLALWSLNKDNPDYQALPDYEKQAYWHLFLPGFSLRIPKPFEVGAIFGSIPEMLGDFIDNGNQHQAWSAFTSNLAHQLNLNPIPHAVKPALDVWSNTNSLTAAPIVNAADQHLIPGERFGPNTSATMTAVGQQLGLAPDQLEYLWKGYGGTLGGYLLSASNALTDAASGKVRPATRIEHVPFVGRFVRTEPALANRWINGFYDVKEEVDQLHATMRDMAKEGRAADAQALVRDNLDKLGLRPGTQAVGSQLNAIRAAMKQINDAPGLTSAEKRERLDQLIAARNTIGASARTIVERARP